MFHIDLNLEEIITQEQLVGSYCLRLTLFTPAPCTPQLSSPLKMIKNTSRYGKAITLPIANCQLARSVRS